MMLNFFYRKKNWDVNLAKLYTSIKNFNEAYKEVNRSSEKCYNLWLKVKYCESLLYQLEQLLRDNFIVQKIGRKDVLSAEFISRRQRECDNILYALREKMNEALNFVHDFVETRQKEGGEDNDIVARKDAREVDKSIELQKDLETLLQDWEGYLREEQGSEKKQKIFDAEVAEKLRLSKLAHPRVDAGDENAILKFKAAVNANKKRDMNVWLPVVRDINAVKRDEVVKNFIKRSINQGSHRIESLKGLQYLGPFGIVSVEEEFRRYFHFDVTNETYEIEKNNKFEGSKISKVIELTVYGETKKRLKIPENAKYYAFVYPVMQSRVDFAGKDLAPVDLVYYFGGYAYFDPSYHLVQLNGLYNDGSDMYFRGPYLLEENENFTDKLTKENRFAKVTIPELIEEGCSRFAWFLPGELGNENHGGFVYQYIHADWPATYFEITRVKQGKYARDVKKAKEAGDEEKERLFSEYFLNNFLREPKNE